MSKYLFFRTDRIGDYIFSRMIVDTIKKNNPNSQIDFVCSEYNSKYIRNFSDIKKIYILDKYNFTSLISNFYNITQEKYDYLIVLDGKRRSIFFSTLFPNIKNKIALVKNFRPKILLNFFFKKYIINSEINSQFENFTSLINYLNFKVSAKINYYQNYKLKFTDKILLPKKYTMLHLDEKWFEGYYYDDFKYMNLNTKNFSNLIKTIKKKFNKSIIITTGYIKTSQFESIKEKFFIKKNNKYIINNFKKNKVLLLEDISFQSLEYLTSKASEIICCEGAISHVSNGFNIKTYALIENFVTAKFWTNHMKNIHLIRRSNIKNICNDLKKLK